MARRGNIALVDMDTGVVLPAPKARTPHSMDGSYTLNAYTDDAPLYSLALSGAEWATIDWVRSNGGAGAAVKVTAGAAASAIHVTETTAKTALARLVKLNILLKTSPRSSTYQLNPRRFWEGSGEAQVQACRRLDPPAITPDKKAIDAAKKAAEKAAAKTPGPRRVASRTTTGGTSR
ncbi:MarR family transcriptional regulator [Kitasatospora sp. NBC_01302]|uniref:MarR family transcriptional regulator n=1 Tax=Kitasatospora sp. NBC_01302 TaxID=2903575 RepID=UPI002E12FF7F|nr:MarR family transcriptional regulator [Kitasatospora sp. NBC_01302]